MAVLVDKGLALSAQRTLQQVSGLANIMFSGAGKFEIGL